MTKPVPWFLRPLFFRIQLLEERIMSELNDAVTRITTSVQNEIAAVVTKLNTPNPDVAAAVRQLNGLSDALDAETAALNPPASGATGATGATDATGADGSGATGATGDLSSPRA